MGYYLGFREKITLTQIHIANLHLVIGNIEVTFEGAPVNMIMIFVYLAANGYLHYHNQPIRVLYCKGFNGYGRVDAIGGI
jgi:hypothetical protein